MPPPKLTQKHDETIERLAKAAYEIHTQDVTSRTWEDTTDGMRGRWRKTAQIMHRTIEVGVRRENMQRREKDQTPRRSKPRFDFDPGSSIPHAMTLYGEDVTLYTDPAKITVLRSEKDNQMRAVINNADVTEQIGAIRMMGRGHVIVTFRAPEVMFADVYELPASDNTFNVISQDGGW